MSKGWAKEEVERIVADYFKMLLSELEGESFNKTEHRKTLSPLLANRSMGSIEFKHVCNGSYFDYCILEFNDPNEAGDTAYSQGYTRQ